MPAYYNEIDGYAAQWLRNLIADDLIAPGDVDERSIVDVRASDLAGYEQCHFFAGIGGWSYALRLAGWPDEREVWTGSCPCQPLSSAGRRQGHADERHLWPAFQLLIAECCPATIFGEQVAGEDGREWLAGVRADLETMGYACGAADLAAAGIGAPHIRQRLFWVAVTEHAIGRTVGRDRQNVGNGHDAGRSQTHGELRARREVRGLANSERGGQLGSRRYEREHASARRSERVPSLNERQSGERCCNETSGMDDASDARRSGERGGGSNCAPRHKARLQEPTGRSAPFWSNAIWLPCLDGKARRIESGTFPMAHGLPKSMAAIGTELSELARMAGLHGQSLSEAKRYRVGSLRGLGNAIVPQVGAEFVAAFMECEP